MNRSVPILRTTTSPPWIQHDNIQGQVMEALAVVAVVPSPVTCYGPGTHHGSEKNRNQGIGSSFLYIEVSDELMWEFYFTVVGGRASE